MRVLQLVKTAAGASWAYRQMRELARLGVEVHLAAPEGPLAENCRAAGIAVHPVQLSLPVRKPWRWPAVRRSLRAVVDRVRPDLIHSHFVGTTLTMRLALGGDHPTPRIFQVPGPLHLEHAAFRAAEIRSAGASDHWIATCRWTHDRYRASGVAADRLHLAYYCSDAVRPQGGATGGLRRELGLGRETPLVGMVAYMYAPKRYLGQARGLKGHEDFIDALAIVRRSVPDVVGVCIGGAWDGAEAYETRIRDYGSKRHGDGLRFLGTRPDVLSLYPDLDVAVHPSHSENLGGSVESLLMGVPTIATDVGGFPDLVVPGATGLLVPPRSPDRLAAALLDTLASPVAARSMAAEGRRRATTMFDPVAKAAEIRRIYEHVLRRPR